MDVSQYWWQAAAAAPPTGDAGDPIGQSLRFRGTQRLEKTSLNVTGPRTISCWFKIGTISDTTKPFPVLFGFTNQFFLCIRVYPGDARYGRLVAYDASGIYKTENEGSHYLDPSAWYHLLWRYDGSNIECFINGTLQWTFARSTNNYTAFRIGSYDDASNHPWNGYQADFHFIDGQALDPTTFGRFNSKGVWVPVDPKKDGDTAWYGTNGFHLDFAIPSNVGKDLSGNGNDFTATGFETTDQTSPNYDIMQDSPTNNFATFNPLWANDYPGTFTLTTSDANLSESSVTVAPTPGTISIDSPSYCEFVIGSTPYYIGIWDVNIADTSDFIGGSGYGNRSLGIYTNGGIYVSGSYVGTASPFNAGDVVGLAYDPTSRELFQWVNGVAANSGNAIRTLPADVEKWAFVSNGSAGIKQSINFGQQPFRYPLPAGFEPLCTAKMPAANLPDTITGTFLGNSNANGTFVYTGCIPARIQYGTIDVKYQDRLGQTDVDFLSNGFKVRSTTSNSGTVNYTVTTTHDGGEYDGNKVPFQSPAPAVSN